MPPQTARAARAPSKAQIVKALKSLPALATSGQVLRALGLPNLAAFQKWANRPGLPMPSYRGVWAWWPRDEIIAYVEETAEPVCV